MVDRLSQVPSCDMLQVVILVGLELHASASDLEGNGYKLCIHANTTIWDSYNDLNTIHPNP
jgi:hypothetical protein